MKVTLALAVLRKERERIVREISDLEYSEKHRQLKLVKNLSRGGSVAKPTQGPPVCYRRFSDSDRH
jgi:hypothetical protein